MKSEYELSVDQRISGLDYAALVHYLMTPNKTFTKYESQALSLAFKRYWRQWELRRL
jgi:hypothetical protein|tara:strand:+ start:995 stop:1165 length:171 start_codon:yes stop_codon:yes gene_type:complete